MNVMGIDESFGVISLGCGDRPKKYVPVAVAFVSNVAARLQVAEKVLIVALWD
jgi:hypothetical protein